MAARKTISTLPAPEVDITKTTFFMNFPSSGGPFYDAALHNQVAMIKLLQSIRMDLATQMPADEIKQKHKWTYPDEVKQLMARPAILKFLVDTAEEWLEEDTNWLVLTYSEKLPAMSESLFATIKASVGMDSWNDPDTIVDENARYTVTTLKLIEDKGTHKQHLELAVAHWMKDNGRNLGKSAAKKVKSSSVARDLEPAADNSDTEQLAPSPQEAASGRGKPPGNSSGLPSECDEVPTRVTSSRKNLGRTRSGQFGGSERGDEKGVEAESGNNGGEDEARTTPTGPRVSHAQSGTSDNPVALSSDGESAADDASATDTVVRHRTRPTDP